MIDIEQQDEGQRRRLDLGLWRRILRHARPYGRSLFGLAVAGLGVAVADTLMPRVTGLIIDAAAGAGGSGLRRYCLQYLGLAAGLAFLVYLFIVFAGKVATGYAYSVRTAAFARLQELSFSYFDRRPVGWIMARLTSDSEKVAVIIPWFLLDLVWGSALIVGISIAMLLANVPLALLVISILPPLAVVSWIFQRKLLRSQRAVRRANSALTAGFNEGIMGARTTKAYVREEASLTEFHGLTTTMYQHSLQNAIQSSVYLPVTISLGSIGVGLALWRGGVEMGSGITLGTLVAFLQYAAFFYIPVQELAERFTQLQAAQASAERLQGLVDTVPEIRDSPDVAANKDGMALDGQESRIREIEFRNVSFAYKEGEPVLLDFNLRVEAGTSIALVGSTGSGKSTIVSLLCRFYEPTEGMILVNGVDYRNRSLGWLQSQLGVVLQAPHLFSGTVRENIRYGKLDAAEDAILDAARISNADPFIGSLERGYETEVGEGGNRLSTGQKQLVALARAVLADPQIFILDEATSSVDTETERLIQGGIERVLRGRISFVIAHRLSTIRSADRILVIDRGRIVERGSHEELMRAHGRYRHMYNNQFAREREELALEAG